MSRILASLLPPLYDGLVIFGLVMGDIGWLGLGIALHLGSSKAVNALRARTDRQLAASAVSHEAEGAILA